MSCDHSNIFVTMLERFKRCDKIRIVWGRNPRVKICGSCRFLHTGARSGWTQHLFIKQMRLMCLMMRMISKEMELWLKPQLNSRSRMTSHRCNNSGSLASHPSEQTHQGLENVEMNSLIHSKQAHSHLVIATRRIPHQIACLEWPQDKSL